MINFTKSLTSSKFLESYRDLSEQEKNNFSLACNKLLSDNFIYGQRYHDDNIYKIINRLRPTIEYYFALIDYELIHDDNYKIFFIKSHSQGVRVRLRKLETVLVLILAKLYSSKSMDVGSGLGVEVSVVMQDLVDEVNKTRIFTKSLNKTDLSSAIKTLKKYKVIEVGTTDINNIESFNILPTIIYIVTNNDLEAIENKLKSLSMLDDLDEGDESDETEEN